MATTLKERSTPLDPVTMKIEDHVAVKDTGRTGVVKVIEKNPLGLAPFMRTGVLVEFDDQVKPSRQWFTEAELTVTQRTHK